MTLQQTLLLSSDSVHGAMPGLVWAYRMQPGETPLSLDVAGTAGALANLDRGWLWLHVDLLDRRAPAWIAGACALPASARAILEGHDDTLVLGHEDGVVHGIAADFHTELAETTAVVGRFGFAVSERLLVTGRRHALAAVESVREALDADTLRPATAFDLFASIVVAFGRTATERLNATTTLLNAVEDRLMTERVSNERRRLNAVRRLAVTVHRPIAALAALFRDDEHAEWALPPSGHAALKRLADRLTALDRDVTMVGERAKLLQEEVTAELQDESNRSLKALAVMSALLLPGSLIAGIFGMNTKGLPLTDTPGGFEIALALIGAATLGFYFVLSRMGARLDL